MRSKKRIELTRGEWFNHFGLSFYLLVPVAMFAYPFLKQCFVSNSISYNYDFPIISIIFLGASIFFYWLNWQRLFFQEFKAQMTVGQFQRAVQATAKELDWRTPILEKSKIIAYRPPEPLGASNTGERITIIKAEDKIYINSIANPDFSRKGYAVKRNQENVTAFLRNTAHILKGEEVEKIIVEKQQEEEEAFWNESEWTVKKILMRLFGYGMAFFLVIISFLSFIEGSWNGIFFVLVAAAIGLTYIKSDIQILLEKKRRSRI